MDLYHYLPLKWIEWMTYLFRILIRQDLLWPFQVKDNIITNFVDYRGKVLSCVISNYLHVGGSCHTVVEMSKEPKSASTENLRKEMRGVISEKVMISVRTHIVFSLRTSCAQQTHIFVPLPPYCFDPISWTKLSGPCFTTSNKARKGFSCFHKLKENIDAYNCIPI